MDRTWKQRRKSGIWLPDEKPPYGWELIEDHPLVTGLEFAFLFNEQAGASICNYVYRALNDELVAGTGGNPVWKNKGLEINSIDATGNATYYVLPMRFSLDDGCTFAGRLYQYPHGPDGCWMSDWNSTFGGGEQGERPIFQWDGATEILIWHTDPGGSLVTNDDPTADYTEYDLAVGRTTNADGAGFIYVNGGPRSLEYNRWDQSQTAFQPCLFWDQFGEYSPGIWQYFYGWSRALSAEEIYRVHVEPYSMFQEVSRAKYFYVTTGQTHELSANIQGATGVATPDLNILRGISGAIAAGSVTPDTITLKLLKELSASIQAGTATPDDVALLIIKVFSASVQAGTAAPDNITLTLLRALTASIQGASDTSAATVAVLRAIGAAITAQSQTPDDVNLLIAGILEFAAAISAASAAPDTVVLDVLRELSASIASESTAPDDVNLAILRQLSASIQAGSATPDDVALLIIRMLSASIQPSTDTATIALGILREISAAIAAGSATPDAVLSVIRDLSATIAPETVTSAISLITAGLGVIVDAIIESLTAKRTMTSLTVDRDLGSLTPERTIEET